MILVVLGALIILFAFSLKDLRWNVAQDKTEKMSSQEVFLLIFVFRILRNIISSMLVGLKGKIRPYSF